MKKTIFTVLIITFTNVICFSQKSSIGSFSNLATNQGNRSTYTQDSLLKLNKLELTDIYLNQVQSLNNILPYASFNIRGQASGVKQIDIPKSKYTSTKRTKVSEKAKNYNETVNENLYEIIPYSDKNEIIKGILFVQEMISRLDQGL